MFSHGRTKPYFLAHMVTVARSSSKLPAEGNHTGTCPSGWQQNTGQANILYSLTFEVFQKQTFSYKTCAITIAETSRRRTVLDRPSALTSNGLHNNVLYLLLWQTA